MIVAISRVLALALLLALLGCSHVDADEGRDAALQVSGAQFIRGEPPAETAGPLVRSVSVAPTQIAGSVGRNCSGDLDPTAVAVAIGLAGDLGYWIVRAGPPANLAGDAPTYAAELAFASRMPPGPRQLFVRAVDAERRFGPPEVRTVTIRERGAAEGRLVVRLSWNNGANLDLHVVDPNGVEIYKRNPSSYERP